MTQSASEAHVRTALCGENEYRESTALPASFPSPPKTESVLFPHAAISTKQADPQASDRRKRIPRSFHRVESF
jgi:hypothetical protein